MGDSARIWSEVVAIPTYGIGEPLKQPLFLHQRVYQGSSGVVYPYPVIDRVFDEKRDQNYTAVFLENQYLKIMILPELGGRVQMALDKTNNYPLSNLYVSMLQRLGIESDEFSTGKRTMRGLEML